LNEIIPLEMIWLCAYSFSVKTLSSPPSDLGSAALLLTGRISRLNRRIHAIVGPVLERELGLQPREMLVFGAIVRGHTQPSQISSYIGTPPPTTSRLLDQLTEGGYLRRQNVPGDLRRFQMELTELGVQTRARALELLGAAMAQALQAVPQQQLLAALEQLSLLEQSLGTSEPVDSAEPVEMENA
jgi:DNA-binding MarR family transcriptional regulator